MNIGKWIVGHRLFEIDRVQYLDFIGFIHYIPLTVPDRLPIFHFGGTFLEHFPTLYQDRALRISDHIADVW